MKIKIIVAKDKDMFEELERLAGIQESKRKVFDRMMRERSEIDTNRCKGRD